MKIRSGSATGPPGPALPKSFPGKAKAALITLVPCQGQGLPQSSRFSVPVGKTVGTLETAVKPAGVSLSGSNPMSRMAISTLPEVSCPAKSSARHASATPIS